MLGLAPRIIPRLPLAPFFPPGGVPFSPFPPPAPAPRPAPPSPFLPPRPAPVPQGPRKPMPPWVPLPGGPYGPELPFKPFEPWGPLNERPPRPDPRDKFSYYRVVLNGVPFGWNPSSLNYPSVHFVSQALTPGAPIKWPGFMKYKVREGSYVSGSLALYAYINKTTNQFELGNAFYTLYGEGAPGETIEGPAVSYDFSNDPYGPDPVEYSQPGAPNPFPGAPNNGDPGYWPEPAGPDPIPEVSPLPLVPLPAVPLPVPALPPLPRPAPVPQPVPLAPSTPALPGTAPARQPITEPLFTPRPLPAPLATPATDTQALTGTGRLPLIVPAGPATTPEDARQYGPQTVTGGGPRVDLQSVSVEVGRIEQKLGIMLQAPPPAPGWSDEILAGIINALVSGITDALSVDIPGTTYEYVAPCDKDETGATVTLNQEIPSADHNEAIVARLDAIAYALGVLKGWKQPVCRTSPPKSNVTVTAYETSGEF